MSSKYFSRRAVGSISMAIVLLANVPAAFAAPLPTQPAQAVPLQVPIKWPPKVLPLPKTTSSPFVVLPSGARVAKINALASTAHEAIGGTVQVQPSGTPYSTPDVLHVNNLPNGALTLSGPVPMVENNPGDWAAGVIQNNIGLLSPDRGELGRLGQPLDFLFAESLSDDSIALAGEPATAKNPSVVFDVPINFPASGYSIDGSTCPNFNYCDGSFGTYAARVEDCLSDADHPSVPQALDDNGQPIPCNTADGIIRSDQANNGYWYDIAPVWGATTTLGPVSGNGTLSIPAQLPVESNAIRIEFALWLADQPDGTSIAQLWDNCGWSTTTNGFDNDPVSQWSCNSNEYALTRFAVQLPQVRVLPAALVQLKALPYTILYQPPGDQSTGSFTVKRSYDVNVSIDKGSQVGNSTSVENKIGVSDDTKISDFLLTLDQSDGQTFSGKSEWDTSTNFGVGLKEDNSVAVAYGDKVGPSKALAAGSEPVLDASGKPIAGSAATYQTEPFWSDRIVLLIDPQAAVWDFGGLAKTHMLGARSSLFAATIRQLDDCAHGSSAWQPVNPKDPTARLSFTPQECAALAGLDPFYGPGQSLDPSKSGRGLQLPGIPNYGIPTGGGSPSSPSFDLSQLYSQATSTSGSTSYAATVTDIIGFSWSNGVSVKADTGSLGAVGKAFNLGFSNDQTITDSETITTSTSMKLTFQVSTVATTTTTTDETGTLGDDHEYGSSACYQANANLNACFQPTANAFLDELFGGIMFQDPNACGNTPLCSALMASTTRLDQTALGVASQQASTNSTGAAAGTPAQIQLTGSKAPTVNPVKPINTGVVETTAPGIVQQTTRP